MKGSLALAVDALPIERIPADIAIVWAFESDRPLRGDAGRLDWRTCGALSRLLQRDVWHGAAAEAALLPSFGRARAARLVLLGLGSPQGFGTVDVKAATRDAVVRAGKLGAASIALSLPGHWRSLVPEGPCAGAILRGAISALEESRSSMRLRLSAPDGLAPRVQGGLDAALRALGETTVSVHLAGPEPVSLATARRPAIPRRDAGPSA